MPAGGPPFEADQFSLFLGADFLLTIREHERNCLDPVRKRLEAGSRRIRSSSGYLLYALIDAVIDTYFPMMERYGTLTDVLEGQVLTNADESVLRDIHVLKRELLDLRHTLWPLREAMAALQRDNTPHIEDGVLPFLRDCSDHAFQLVDIVEVYRETAQGLVDLHLSSLSNRMNEIMKVLTIIATIFIPMTFITGLYGMNFDRSSPWNMPELGWKYGYEYLLGLLLVIFVVMLVGFWRQGWILQGLRKPRRGPLAGRGAGPRDHHGGSGDVKRN